MFVKIFQMLFILEHPREIRFFYAAIIFLSASASGLIMDCPGSIAMGLLITSVIALGASLQNPRIFPWLLFLFIFFMGLTLASRAGQTAPEIDLSFKSGFSGIILEPVEIKNGKIQAITRVIRLTGDSPDFLLNQKILLKINGDKILPFIRDTICFSGKIRSVPAAKNPDTFCQKKYYQNKGIYYASYAQENEIFLNSFAGFHILNFADRISRKLTGRINAIIPDSSAASFITAIFLGDKSGLSQEVKQAFSKTGAAHVLAVSGLHVGIIFGILAWLIGLPGRGSFIRRILKCLAILASIWIYACITGLSPSVQRAACMLSIYVIGRTGNRHAPALNVVGFVACLVVALNPKIVLHIGFQFSFGAILGILLFYQPIKRMIYMPFGWLASLWSMCAVTLAAQVFIFPLSIYYFNQFPLPFLLASIVAIPVTAFLLSGTMAACIISLISFPFAILAGRLLAILYSILFSFLSFLEKWQPASWSTLKMDISQMFLLFGLIIFLVLFLEKRKKYLLVLAGCFLFLFHCAIRMDIAEKSGQRKFSIYHRYQDCVLSIMEGRKMYFFEGDKNSWTDQYLLSPQVVSSRIKKLNRENLFDQYVTYPEFLKYDGHFFWDSIHILIVDDRLKVHENLTELYPADLVVFAQHDPAILEKINCKKGTVAVICASIPPWDRDALRDVCAIYGLPVYDISMDGAFSMTIHNELNDQLHE